MDCLKKRFVLCLISLLIVFLIISCNWIPDTNKNYSGSSSWMSNLSDSTRLTDITIPATHDSLALYDYIIAGTSRNQELSLYEQLNAGIRCVDIRVSKQANGDLAIYHGLTYMYINLEDVFNITYKFLQENPTETVLMMIREEVFESSGDGSSFASDIDNLIDKNSAFWYLGTTIPANIGEVRGKIVLLRRYDGDTKDTRGIYIRNGHTYFDEKGEYKIPSRYIKTIEEKWEETEDYIYSRENSSYTSKLYYFTASAYKALIFGLPNIDSVASYINPKLTSLFKELKGNGKKYPFMIACDKVYPELIYSIYSLNL